MKASRPSSMFTLLAFFATAETSFASSSEGFSRRNARQTEHAAQYGHRNATRHHNPILFALQEQTAAAKPRHDDDDGDDDDDDLGAAGSGSQMQQAIMCDQPLTSQRDGKTGSGAYLCEKFLTPRNVNKQQFGKLSTIKVPSQVYAQPLYLPRHQFDGKHDVLFIATNANTIHCVDINNRRAPRELWKTTLGTPVPVTQVYGNYKDIHGDLGILSTPVIDLSTGTLYAVTHTYENSKIVHSLHAINIMASGASLGKTVIEGGYPGTGDQDPWPTIDWHKRDVVVDGLLQYDAELQIQRTALTLYGDHIVFGMGSVDDRRAYHGWVFGYHKDTLRRVGVYCNTPDSGGGGIWQSGAGITVDNDGNFLVVAGNGFRANPNKGQLIQSVVKLRLTEERGFEVLDYAISSAWQRTSDDNADMSTSCVVMGDQCAVGSKDGHLYLINLKDMGKIEEQDRHLQKVKAALKNIHSVPVPWNSNFGEVIFLGGEEDFIKAYAVKGGRLQADIMAKTDVSSEPSSRPGAMLTLSADGAGNGLLFSNMVAPQGGNANPDTVPGIMRVFDLGHLNQGTMKELYNTREDPNDDIGNFAKFNPVAIKDGHVFVPSFGNKDSFDGAVHIFGLKDGNPLPSSTGRGDDETASSSTGPLPISSTGNDWSSSGSNDGSTGPLPFSSTGIDWSSSGTYDGSSTGLTPPNPTPNAAASIGVGSPQLMLPLVLGAYLANSWRNLWHRWAR